MPYGILNNPYLAQFYGLLLPPPSPPAGQSQGLSSRIPFSQWEQIGDDRYPVAQYQPPTVFGVDPVATVGSLTARRFPQTFGWDAARMVAQLAGTGTNLGLQWWQQGDPRERLRQRGQTLSAAFERRAAAQRLGILTPDNNWDIARAIGGEFPIITGPRGEQY